MEFDKNQLGMKSCQNLLSTLALGWEAPSVSKTCQLGQKQPVCIDQSVFENFRQVWLQMFTACV